MRRVRGLLVAMLCWNAVAAAAPVVAGSRAEFVGFMGKREEYALIYVTPFRPEVEPAVLYLVPMHGETTKVQWPVALHASVLAERPSPKTFYEYYRFRLAKVQRTQLGEAFTEAAARIVPLPLKSAAPAAAAALEQPTRPATDLTTEPAPAAPASWSTPDEAMLQVGPEQFVGVRIAVEQEIIGARPFEARNGYVCAEWEQQTLRLHCESCFQQDMPTGLGTRLVSLCRPGSGRLTRNVQGVGSKIWPRGIRCDCTAPAYRWVPEVRWNKSTRVGVATLATPMDADPAIFQTDNKTWGPPEFRIVEGVPQDIAAFRNRAGDVIITGAAVRMGPQRITQFPLIATIPQPDEEAQPPIVTEPTVATPPAPAPQSAPDADILPASAGSATPAPPVEHTH